MPVYDYECGQCAHKFEQRRSFSEGSSATCPKCRQEAKRVFAAVPIVFKGSGFYVTDYRKEKTPADEKAPAPKAVPCHKDACTSSPSGKCDGSSCKK
jgi:putative FmdB family regulatory protein